MEKGSRRDWRRRITMILGDVLVLFLFILAGRRSHSMSAFAPQLVETTLPFVMSLLVVGAIAGAFNPSLLARPMAMAGRVSLTWAIACPIGLIIRSRLLDRPIATMFALITFSMVWALLLVWRTALAHFMKPGEAQADTSNRHRA